LFQEAWADGRPFGVSFWRKTNTNGFISSTVSKNTLSYLPGFSLLRDGTFDNQKLVPQLSHYEKDFGQFWMSYSQTSREFYYKLRKKIDILNHITKSLSFTYSSEIIHELNKDQYKKESGPASMLGMINPLSGEMEWISVQNSVKHNISTIICQRHNPTHQYKISKVII